MEPATEGGGAGAWSGCRAEAWGECGCRVLRVQSAGADLRRAEVELGWQMVGSLRLGSLQRRTHAQRVEAHILARGAPPLVAHGHRDVQRAE